MTDEQFKQLMDKLEEIKRAQTPAPSLPPYQPQPYVPQPYVPAYPHPSYPHPQPWDPRYADPYPWHWPFDGPTHTRD